jgi:hypothetical protein
MRTLMRIARMATSTNLVQDELLAFPQAITAPIAEFVEDVCPNLAPFRVVSWYAYCREKAAHKRAEFLGEAPQPPQPSLYYARLAVKI